MTQTDLARAIGIRQESIARFENDNASPSEAQFHAIAAHTGVTPAFFTRKPISADVGEAMAYRCRASVPAKDKNQARQYVLLLSELLQDLCATLRPPTLNIPSANMNPEKAARFMRTVLGLFPDEPIGHLVNVLERNGAVVLAIPLDRKRIDATSTLGNFDRERPIVGLFNAIAGDRQRFNVAHELGHLVLHRNVAEHSRVTEQEADRFAAEFLLPAHRMRQVLPELMSLATATEIKKEWRVSIQAIVRRARDLGVITDRRYKTLFTQLSANGWRTREPVHVPVERPRLLRQMVEMKYGADPVGSTARVLGIGEELAENILRPFAEANMLARFKAGTHPYEYPGNDPNQKN